MLRLWKMVEGVPIYVRPPLLTVKGRKMTVKGVHEAYRCLLSKNFNWKSRVHTTRFKPPAPAPPPEKMELVVVVLTGRAKPGKKEEVIAALKAMGKRINPYSKGPCFGFYARTEEEIVETVARIAPLVEAVAIVNTVVYFNLGRHINLKKVAEAGFVMPSIKTFKDSYGKLNGLTLRVFFNGTIGVYGPIAPDKGELEKVWSTIYWFLREAGAI